MPKRHLVETVGEVVETLDVRLLAICWGIKEFLKALPFIFLGGIIQCGNPPSNSIDSQEE